jgi:hypothetical protein
VKKHQVAIPSGRIAPTPKPYGNDPNADPAKVVPQSEWTPDIHRVVRLIEQLHQRLLTGSVAVTVVNTSNGFAACYGKGNLDLNLRRLGHAWFKRDNLPRQLSLIVHELGHHYSRNYLSDDYYKALTSLAGRLAQLALDEPGLFE